MSRRKKTTHPTPQKPTQARVTKQDKQPSPVIASIETIQQENEEAEKDWGVAEQNAYERMLEGNSQRIPVEEFLDWLDELQQGKKV